MRLTIPAVQDLGGVFLLDTRHGGNEGTVGVFLLPGDDSFCLIETGPGATLATVQKGIAAVGFALEQLEHILVTHVHLDHAGAAGALAQTGARVYVHEKGYSHLADPSKLLVSAGRIYGELMESLWGTMLPIPETQLQALRGGERLELGGHFIDVLYTPGHASHHVAYLLDGETLFTGDAAAIRLMGSSIIRPAMPPPEVNLELWQSSIEIMLAVKAKRLMLTHFGEVREVEAHLRAVPERNQVWAEAILKGMQAGENAEALVRRIAALGNAELEADRAAAEVIKRHQLTSSYEMTVMGVSRYWQKQHPEKLVL